MASENEIDEALDVAKQHGNGEVLLFHCISNYPTVTEESNIRMISTFVINMIVKLACLIIL